MTDVNAIWDEAHLKALLQFRRSPRSLIQTLPWEDWIQQRGGLPAVYHYLLTLEELAEEQRHLLQVILDHPQQPAEFYAAQSHISRKTYFRALPKLLIVLERGLNRWTDSMPATLRRPPASSLPAPRTSFVGRDQEMLTVKHLLATSRLLTLTGPGGIGKTRLALQVAPDLRDVFSDGVWFVELGPLSDPSLVPQTVATTLGVREIVGRPITETLSDYLRTKKDSLLLLDNCEHMVEACAKLADSLLQTCPDLHLLTSSREALGIAGEIPFPVPSLSLPDPEKSSNVEGVTDSEAVQLFVERARAVLPGFEVTKENATAVAQICHQLEGIPLALELAAARVKLLKVEQIAARLDDRFRLLAVGSQTAPRRQQTLRAAIDWSYDLLSEPESTLLRRLAVFINGWTLEAAEQVAGEGAPTPNRPPFGPDQVLDLLTQLVNKSLVVVEAEAGPEVRYRLLETIRQYAWEKLVKSGDEAPARNRHLEFFLHLAEATEPKLFGTEALAALERLEMERDNLRAALEWSLEKNATRIEEGLRLAGALYWFWHLHVHFNEGIDWLKRLLTTGTSQTAARAKALTGIGWLMALQMAQGGTPIDAALALALSQESLALFKQLGDKLGAAFALRSLSAIYLYSQPMALDQCQAALEEGLALFQEEGDKFGMSEMILMLGYIARAQGDLDRAESLFEEVLGLRREIKNLDGIAWTLSRLGSLAALRGNYERAKALLSESLFLWQELDFKEWTLYASNSLIELMLLECDYEQARAFAQESLAAYRETGAKNLIANSLLLFGNSVLGLGDHRQAGTVLKECLSLSRAIGHQWVMVAALQTLAGVAVAQGQPQSAARLFGAAEAGFEALQSQLVPYQCVQRERDLTILRSALDEASLATTWAAGRAMTPEQAVAYALEADHCA